MSFAELAPLRLHDMSPRPQPAPSRYRMATEAGRRLVCRIVAFLEDEGCAAVPTPNWLAVAVGGNGRTLTLEVLDRHEADPGVRGRAIVRSVDDARAAALRAGLIEDFSTGVVA